MGEWLVFDGAWWMLGVSCQLSAVRTDGAGL